MKTTRVKASKKPLVISVLDLTAEFDPKQLGILFCHAIGSGGHINTGTPDNNSFTGQTDMKGFVDDIEKATENNDDFRRVIYTGKNLQLVLMALQPGAEIGEEIHEDRDQFFRIEVGQGVVLIDGVSNNVKADDGIVVPAGARHNVVNSGSSTMKLYTLYGPPEHIEGTVHKTKADAVAAQEHFDGRTTE